MAKRYSPLTVVVLVGAFALLGYMGARLSQKQAFVTRADPPAPALHLTQETLAPTERNGEMLATGTPADVAKSVAAPAGAAAPTRLPPNETAGERTTVTATAPQSLQPTPPAVPLQRN